MIAVSFVHVDAKDSCSDRLLVGGSKRREPGLIHYLLAAS